MIKYSPIKSAKETFIKITSDISLEIDGEEFVFPESIVLFENLNNLTDGKIIEAHRENDILYVTVRRFYTGFCEWDTGDYQ